MDLKAPEQDNRGFSIDPPFLLNGFSDRRTPPAAGTPSPRLDCAIQFPRWQARRPTPSPPPFICLSLAIRDSRPGERLSRIWCFPLRDARRQMRDSRPGERLSRIWCFPLRDARRQMRDSRPGERLSRIWCFPLRDARRQMRDSRPGERLSRIWCFPLRVAHRQIRDSRPGERLSRIWGHLTTRQKKSTL